MTSVGIHQPNFMPWLGYFLKVAVSDVFVFHDNVEFTKKSLTKRTYIQKSIELTEKKYLGIPIVKHSDSALIKTLEIDHKEDWVTRSKNVLSNTYRNAEFYAEYAEFVFDIFENGLQYSNFAEFAIYSNLSIMDFLNLDSSTLVSSTLEVSGQKSEYNINLIKHADGKIYNSGNGAKKYQTIEEFNDAGIELRYLDSFAFLTDIKAEYPSFNPGYSIIDNIFHLGKDNLIEIINRYKEHYDSIFRKA